MTDALRKLFSFLFDFMSFVFGLLLLFKCVSILSEWLDIYQMMGGM